MIGLRVKYRLRFLERFEGAEQKKLLRKISLRSWSDAKRNLYQKCFYVLIFSDPLEKNRPQKIWGLREVQIQLFAKLLEFVCNELYLRADNDLYRVLCRAENTLDA